MEAVEEGLGVDFFDAVEFVEGLIINKRCGKGGIGILGVVADLMA